MSFTTKDRDNDQLLACVAWRFCRAGRTSSEAAKKNKKPLPPQSPRGFSALARLYYLARPTKTAMLRRLTSCLTTVPRDLKAPGGTTVVTTPT